MCIRDSHDEHTRVRKCGGMDGINNRGRDINRGLKTECQLGAPQIVVDRLGQRYHVYTLHAQQVCGLVRAVAAPVSCTHLAARAATMPVTPL